MSKLVVYYSRTGRTKRVAEQIAQKLEAKTALIQDTKSREGLIGWFKSGFDAFTEKKAEINFDNQIDEFDTLIVGSPVWAGKLTPAIRTFLGDIVDNKQKLAFFATCGNSVGETFEIMEKLSKKPVATLELNRKQLKDNEIVKQNVNQFCNDIQESKA